jgi:hypothetical protein
VAARSIVRQHAGRTRGRSGSLLDRRLDDAGVDVFNRDFGPDEHRLDPPPQRLGRIGAGEVLVVDACLAGQAHSIEGPRGDHHQGRDVPVLVVEQGVHLQGPVEFVLAVEDGYADVPAIVQQLLEFVGGLDLDRLIAGLGELRAYSGVLCRG